MSDDFPIRKWLGTMGDAFPIIRAQQDIVSKSVPYAWMVSIMDAGMKYDIHPIQRKSS